MDGSVALYGSERWTMRENEIDILQEFEYEEEWRRMKNEERRRLVEKTR